jgi:5'-deoxynucleotidase YfbR-like HD superfamily hydrolase
MIKEQSVAEHSYFVALYAARIASLLSAGIRIRAAVMAEALSHDLDEVMTGDVPSPAKRHLRGTATLAEYLEPVERMKESIEATMLLPSEYDYVRSIVKLADVFEAGMKLADELDLGNTTVANLYHSHYAMARDAAIAIDKSGALWQNHLQPALKRGDRIRTVYDYGMAPRHKTV